MHKVNPVITAELAIFYLMGYVLIDSSKLSVFQPIFHPLDDVPKTMSVIISHLLGSFHLSGSISL